MQEEAFLETVKGLEGRAARAEMMQGGERATREVGGVSVFALLSQLFARAVSAEMYAVVRFIRGEVVAYLRQYTGPCCP